MVTKRILVYYFLWEISAPSITPSIPHPLDNYANLWRHGKANCNLLLLVFLARLLDGRPIKRTVLLFPPMGGGGWGSKKPLGDFIRNFLGSYSALVKPPFYPMIEREKMPTALSLRREGKRCLFGQAIDTALPRGNAVFKRRADFGSGRHAETPE